MVADLGIAGACASLRTERPTTQADRLISALQEAVDAIPADLTDADVPVVKEKALPLVREAMRLEHFHAWWNHRGFRNGADM